MLLAQRLLIGVAYVTPPPQPVAVNVTQVPVYALINENPEVQLTQLPVYAFITENPNVQLTQLPVYAAIRETDTVLTQAPVYVISIL